MLKRAGKEAMAEGRYGWIPISTSEYGNLGFLLQALGAQKCPHRVVAAAVPGWLKQGTAWLLFLAALSLCSGCLPAGLCQLHHPEEPQGFFWSQLYASGQQERLQTECSMRLQPLELGEKGGSGVRTTPRPKKGSCSSRSP